MATNRLLENRQKETKRVSRSLHNKLLREMLEQAEDVVLLEVLLALNFELSSIVLVHF